MLRNIILVTVAWVIAITLSFPAFLVASVAAATKGKEVIGQYLLNVAIGIDQMGASILGFNPDTTISGNIGYRIQNGRATIPEVLLCKLLRALDVEHCTKNIEGDEVHYNLLKDKNV